uniref:Uncharacterized protein n=1 Tax=Tanacetum cinerariifolium TaxID=118510 RepID=A0A6L2N2E4_TANCI|nr:hypothetical protein [Tanacetum cinerariifolium]
MKLKFDVIWGRCIIEMAARDFGEKFMEYELLTAFGLGSKSYCDDCVWNEREASGWWVSFFLQLGFTLILATLDGLDVGFLGDVIGEDDCDDDG